MGYASSLLRDEAAIANLFVEAVVAAMNRQPPINALCFELERYKSESGLLRLTARREEDLRRAADAAGLLMIMTRNELCFVRFTGSEHGRTESLSSKFLKKLSDR